MNVKKNILGVFCVNRRDILLDRANIGMSTAKKRCGSRQQGTILMQKQIPFGHCNISSFGYWFYDVYTSPTYSFILKYPMHITLTAESSAIFITRYSNISNIVMNKKKLYEQTNRISTILFWDVYIGFYGCDS